MRALVYSDLQATDGHEKCHKDPTRSLQLYRVNKLYADLRRIYTEQKCDSLWDLGDTTDDRSAIPVPAIHEVCSGLAQFPVGGFHLKLIGNHEQYLRQGTVNVGQMFSPYFQVVEEPQCFTVEGVNILCCPYPAEDSALGAWIDSQQGQGGPAMLLGHFQILGCFGCSGQLMSGIAVDRLKWLKVGLLGHIHRPQQIGNCHYVGSPFQQDWGEAGEAKRVAIVDIKKGVIKVSWVPLTGYPEYVSMNLDEFINTPPEGENRIRVILKSSAEATEFYACPHAQIAEPQYDFAAAEASVGPGSIVGQDAWNPHNSLRRYLEANPPAARGITQSTEEMLGYGMDLLTP